ncbi:TIGR03790 family protein [Roseateles sp. DXS20W]|uniref:TIGR03790 family protein n=1 Tax=Pelomonas lactea TaxID=3299030 RepID=A0ABW7GL77_9BURK
MPKLYGRITAAELGLVINTADPYSVTIGEYYARRRGIPDANIVRVQLPQRANLTRDEFTALNDALRSQLPESVNGLALAWVQPYAVDCNSLTSALGQGLQPDVCANSCAPTRPSPYVSYFGARPWVVLGLRPAMQLAARSVPAAMAMIERGIASDHFLAGGAAQPAVAYLAATPDANRNVRERLFPPAGPVPGVAGFEVARVRSDALPPLRRTLVYQTGLARVPAPLGGEWLPGALADHLTSFGGQLDRPAGEGQMNILDWIDAGATATYGTASEPCNHLQKFPHPQVLIQAYAQGVSALEAYWHSVAWPAQGVFVGEPLAAPFAPVPTTP